MTLDQAAEQAGLSRSRVSQLVHGYEQTKRAYTYPPVLREGEHWTHEMRGRRFYTVITPAGLDLLRQVKEGKVQQERVKKEES